MFLGLSFVLFVSVYLIQFQGEKEMKNNADSAYCLCIAVSIACHHSTKRKQSTSLELAVKLTNFNGLICVYMLICVR